MSHGVYYYFKQYCVPFERMVRVEPNHRELRHSTLLTCYAWYCAVSKTELPCGLYGVVRVFLYPKTVYSSLTSWFSNSFPISECSNSGTLNTENSRSTRVCAMVVASLFVIAARITKRVRWSITDITFATL